MYLSSTISLAALEILVHADPEDLPDPYLALPVEIPDEVDLVESIDPAACSTRWREYPAPPELASFGDRWVRGQRSVLARAASALVPQELNFLLHPAHPDRKRLGVGQPVTFSFDPRLHRP